MPFMALPKTPFPLPDIAIQDSTGAPTSTRSLAQGPMLLIFGHTGCKTTRQTIPYVDRIHCSGGRARALLQDTTEDAREGLKKLGADLPFATEAAPFPFARAVGADVVPILFFVESDGTVSATSEAFRKSDLEAFAAKLGAPSPVLPGDTMPGFKPG
jgi:hypothetical protein